MKLYRFEIAIEERIKAIEAGLLYFSSPIWFNDLADCDFRISLTSKAVFSHEKIKAALHELYQGLDNPTLLNLLQPLLKLRQHSVADPRSSSREFLRMVQQNNVVGGFKKSLAKTTGVCCFFGNAPNDPRMWAHYGGNHLGLCMEYEVDENSIEAYEKLHQITYANAFLSIDVDELLFNPQQVFRRLLSTKQAAWASEDEYRLIHLSLLDNGVRGKLLPLPAFFKPSRVICGYRQGMDTVPDQDMDMFNKTNFRMQTLAAHLGVPRARVRYYEGRLSIEDI